MEKRGHVCTDRSRDRWSVESSPKMVLICIDGLSWNLLHRFCEEGILPNFDKIIKNGVSGELKSIYPLISPRIWATIFTGKDPQKHGVRDFYINAETIRTKQIWEILQENGHRVGVFRPLTAFTPNGLYSFFVPGDLSAGNDAYPGDLGFLNDFCQEFRARAKISILRLFEFAYRLLRHGCEVRTLLEASWTYLHLLCGNVPVRDRTCKLKQVETVLHSKVFIHSVRRYSPTFTVFYDNGIDYASHSYWKYVEPANFGHVDEKKARLYGDAIRKYYVLMDKIIGEIVSVLGNKAYFVIASDHGFRADSKYREISAYTRPQFEINVFSLLSLLKLTDKVYGIKALKGGIFRPKNDEISLEELEGIFKDIRYVHNGKRVFLVERLSSHVNARVDLKSLDRTHGAVLADSSECSLEDFMDFVSVRSGQHSTEGVLILKGPGIRTEAVITKSSVYDICPTIMAIYKIPIPRDMDGKVLSCIFEQETDVRYSDELAPSKSIASRELLKEEEDHIRQKLKELGYL